MGDDWGNEVAVVVAGSGIEVDSTNPRRPIVSATGGGGGVESVVAGTNVTVDDTDPANPIVSASGGGGGGVETISGGINIVVDSTDPANPIVTFAPGTEEGTFIDLAPSGDYVTVQGAPGEYIGISVGFGVNVFTTKPFTINSAVPMRPPAAANVPGTLDPALYGGGMIYDSALHIMLWSDGTAWWEFGKVVTVSAGEGIAVDSTDPANPIVSVEAPEAPE